MATKLLDNVTIGFLGAGKMATALAMGIIRSGLISSERIFASDVSNEALGAFVESTRGTRAETNRELLDRSKIVILAVKPQQLSGILDEVQSGVTQEHLVVSIAAGISLSRIEDRLPPGSRVVRVMPNTPCLVAAGACAYSPGSNASGDDSTIVETLLRTVGSVERIPENLMDAVTGLSGSGPAYVYQIIEALSDGGVRMGLPRSVATQLAAQTVYGAARMVIETGEHPGSLKDAVTSPGGTTIAGLHELERGGLRGILMNAVESAATRSSQLG